MSEIEMFGLNRTKPEIEKEKSEHIPTSEEMQSLDVRKLEDEKGLYLWEVKITQEYGSVEYSYIRKGDYKSRGLAGGSALETAIHITYFDNDKMPISGHSLFKLIDDRWVETP